MSEINLESLTSLCKRRGFIYPSSEIYGGLAGVWDYGPLGLALKRNIVNLWWKTFVEDPENIYGIETGILMNPKVWEASGHVATFHDPLIEDLKTKKRYRLDQLLSESGIDPEGMTLDEMAKIVKTKSLKSPDGNQLAAPAMFNLMFKTAVGPIESEGSFTYLRPETAQGMFVNFKNIIDSYYPNLPFGLAQVGRSFRNEISPRDFVFRSRELEIMELEYFVNPARWEEAFESYLKIMKDWFVNKLELSKGKLKDRKIPEADRAHYSKRTVDFEYQYPTGFKEIAGLAYRTDFDLMSHQKHSGKSMEYTIKGTQESFVPHVIEPTFGVERHVLAVLAEAYHEDEINGEKRIYLSIPAKLAPIKVAVFPLLKNKAALVNKSRQIFNELRKNIGSVEWDDNGNIGKRYRRQDEIGTPLCVTIDFQTLDDDSVTVRDRDSTKQKRIKVKDLLTDLKAEIENK